MILHNEVCVVMMEHNVGCGGADDTQFSVYVCVCVCVCVCLCAYMCACVCACVRASERACMPVCVDDGTQCRMRW